MQYFCLRRPQWVLIILLSLRPASLASAGTNSGFNAGETVVNMNDGATTKFIKTHFGVSYNSFFSGPGLTMPAGYPPAFSGMPADTGLNFVNAVSVKYKLTSRYAIDLQFLNEVVVTNSPQFRYQGQRLGISGRLFGGSDWSINGAVNTDVPIRPIMGQIASQRTLLLSPGFFGSFVWEPKKSRWSVFALLAPRMWIYSNRDAIAIQDTFSGGIMNKPQFDFLINPSINYKINDKVGWRLGTTFDFLKNIGWSHFQRNYLPIETGITWDISPQFGIYTYFTTSTPLDNSIRAMQLATNNPPGWLSTASINLWIYGTLF